MDDYSGKIAVDEPAFSRKASRVISRDARGCLEHTVHFRDQRGNTDKLNLMKAPQIACSQKCKASKTSFKCSTTGKEIGSSSSTCPTLSSSRKPPSKTQKTLSSHLEAYRSESSNSSDSDASSSGLDEQRAAEPIRPYGNIGVGHHPEHEDTVNGESKSMEVGSTSAILNKRPWRNFIRRSMLGSQDMPSGSSCSVTPKSPYQGSRQNANANRYGLRNMKCNSISDVISPGCSSSDLRIHQRKEMLKKKNLDGERSSSSRGKKISLLDNGRNSISPHGILISESRHAPNRQASHDNGVASVGTRRSINQRSSPGAWIPCPEIENNSSLNLYNTTFLEMTEAEVPITVNAPSSPHSDSLQNCSSCPNSHSSLVSGEILRGAVSAESPEIARSLRNRGGFRFYNMDGITRALVSLERIEQDEELAYRQLFVLETNVLFDGLSFRDQHRDMRLDVDNMSYEELLALEERMGTVSTALTEEALVECLMRSVHNPTPLEDQILGFDREDEVKCSICQEEYIIGNEVGRLHCHHTYHVECIHHWLRQKNWCPICKASAMPFQSSSPS